jgi:hypothetical protein
MLAHSHVWLNDPRIRDALAADPIGRVLLAKLGKVHGNLSETQSLRLLLETRIADMTEILGELDDLHDDTVRALYFAITAAAFACKDPDQTRELLEIRDLLFPSGLTLVKTSYMNQSGAAVEARSRITTLTRIRLHSIVLDGRNLTELLDEWFHTAETIGRLTHERSSLLASITGEGTDAARVDRNSARREWIQVTQALLSNLPFMDLPDKMREEIAASLTRAVRAAEQRRSPADPGDAEPAPDAPAPDAPADTDVIIDDTNAAGTAPATTTTPAG